jgi:ABC-2 type transport system permease protein
MAATLGGVRLAPPQWLLLGITLVLGGLPFCVLGLAIGYIAHANSAPAVVNTLYLPMALCSGLWLPIQVLPEAMRHAAPMLPPYHLAQIALSILGAPSYGSVAGHAAALAAFTVVFAALALIAQTRERETM